jgi:hypothetical protein
LVAHSVIDNRVSLPWHRHKEMLHHAVEQLRSILPAMGYAPNPAAFRLGFDTLPEMTGDKRRLLRM